MPRATAGLRAGFARRLADLERRTPEWRTWLRLLGEAQRASGDPGWDARFAEAGVEQPGAGSSPGAPLLDGRTILVDPRRVRRLVRRLAETAAAGDGAGAASLGGYRPSAADTVRLLAAALRGDRAAVEAVAAPAGMDPGALEAVAQLAVLPLLHSCGRLLQDRVPLSWPQGYCPICGGWPVLAELRGLDRTRRLRCGRCGGDWRVNWLSCASCGETDHEQLGSLVPDDQSEVLKVETCARCRGYLKTVATLQAIPPFELLLWDLETVALDLVALDRGYTRPQGTSYAVNARVAARPSPPRWRFGP